MFTMSPYRRYKQTRIWSGNSKTAEWNNVFTNWSAGWLSVVAENNIFQFTYCQKYVHKSNGTSMLFQLSYREKMSSFLILRATFLPWVLLLQLVFGFLWVASSRVTGLLECKVQDEIHAGWLSRVQRSHCHWQQFWGKQCIITPQVFEKWIWTYYSTRRQLGNLLTMVETLLYRVFFHFFKSKSDLSSVLNDWIFIIN